MTQHGTDSQLPPTPIALARAAAADLVEAVPPARIAEFATLVPLAADVFKGFSVSPEGARATLVKRRLAKTLSRSEVVATEFIVVCPGPWHDVAAVLREFSESWLLAHWRALCRLAGTATVPAALALDPREPFASRGRRVLRRAALWKDHLPAPRDSDRELERGLQRLLPKPEAPPPAATPAPPKATKEPHKHKRNHEIDRLREQLETERRTAEENRRRHLAELKEAQARTREAEEQLRAEQSEREALVRQRMDQYRRDVMGIDDLVSAEKSDQNAIAEADRVLDEQAALDEKFGFVSTLQAQICELRKRLTALDTAGRESLNPHPDLAAVRERVAAEIETLERRLGHRDGEPVPPIALALLKRLEAVPAQPGAATQLDAVVNAAENPVMRGILGPVWVREVRIAAENRRETLERLERERHALEAAPKTPRGPRELFRVGVELQRLGNAGGPHVFVDAYNLLLTTNPALLSPTETQALARARQELETNCRRLFPGAAHVELVYDGLGTVQTRETEGNLTVVFAPKREEDQNADNLIVDRIREIAGEGGEDPLWLVTSDAELRARVAAYCDAFVSVESFARFLSGPGGGR